MTYHVSNKFLKKIRIYLWSLGIFIFPWVLAPYWQHLGWRFWCQPSPVELYYWLIDLNQDSSHAGGKIRTTLKDNKNFDIFVNFWLNQIQNCSQQIKKMKDVTFSFQFKKKKKNFCRTLTDNMLDIKTYPLLMIWLESWNHAIKGMIEVYI